MDKKILEDSRISLRIKLAGLWAAAMFCYLYADILAFYDAYLIGEILKGNMGPIGPITQELKLAFGVLMSIPALLLLANLMVKPVICRWLNIGFGSLFTLIIIATTIMSPFYYYIYFGLVEIAITSSIVWLSLKWPVTLSK